MPDNLTKVIGCFAYKSPESVVCSGPGCVIAGSEKAMADYLREIDPAGWRNNTIRKTRFGEILRGMELGASYAFDQESFTRFHPLARAAGVETTEADFDTAARQGDKFLVVTPLRRPPDAGGADPQAEEFARRSSPSRTASIRAVGLA